MVLALYIAHVNAEQKLKPPLISRKPEEDLFKFPKPETVSKYEYHLLKGQYEDYKRRCQILIGSVELVEPLIGGPYLKVNMDVCDFNNLKASLK